eukprot:scaffold8359_cov75-Skeletonema_dohrnii-CCMP3373.AAC.1
MKITLPLSFLLCLPAMAMATDSAPLLLRGALQDQAVDAEAEVLQRKLEPMPAAPKTKSAKYNPNRRLEAKSAKAMKGDGRRLGAKSAKAQDPCRRRVKSSKLQKPKEPNDSLRKLCG